MRLRDPLPVRNRQREKDSARKRESGGYVAFPHILLRSETLKRLSAIALKLLVDLLAQYKGNNNGDLCAAWTLMEKRGWKSRDTLGKAIRELKVAKLIEVSRQGGRHAATLYALTFFAVDECHGKLDIEPTHAPKSLWRENEPPPPALLANLKVVPRPQCQSTAD